MSAPYIRAMELTAGPISIKTGGDAIDARVEFDVEHWTTSNPNVARITLYNLSDATAKSVKEGDPVVLKAGYVGNLQEIFRGQAVQLRKGKRAGDPTITYRLLALDGDIAHNQAAISTTLAAAPPGQTARTALDAIYACAGVLSKNGAQLALSDQMVTYLKDPKWTYPKAKPLEGMVRDVLTDICRWTNTQWSIQHGKLVIVPIRAPWKENDPIEVNAKTNMLGLPELTIEGVVVRTIIDGRIDIGQRIHLNNASIQQSEAGVTGGGGAGTGFLEQGQGTGTAALDADGIYVVLYRSIKGDTRGGEDAPWEFNLICTDAAGQSPPIERLSPFYPSPGQPFFNP